MNFRGLFVKLSALAFSVLLINESNAYAAPPPAPRPPAPRPAPHIPAPHSPAPYQSSVGTVPNLDVKRFSGKWDVVASTKQPFMMACSSDLSMTFYFMESRKQAETAVISCRTIIGMMFPIQAEMRRVNPDNSSELQIVIPGLNPPPANRPNYLVNYVDPSYQEAILSDPIRSLVFVLSRTPALSAAQWNNIKAVLTQHGFNPAALNTQIQAGGDTTAHPI